MVVIGAGIVGAAVAAGLARRGAQVTVLEARYPGAGTTATSFAWVNAGNKDPEPYFALNYAGVRAHHELAKGQAPWFHPTGNLEWAVSDEHRANLHARVEKLRGRDYPVRWLTTTEARTLEPDLAQQPPHTEYAFFPTEAHTLPTLLLAYFLGDANDHGATIINGAEVIEADNIVTTADGNRYPADIVVSCIGRWTSHVPMLNPDLAGSATVGFLATTTPVPTRLSRVLTTPKLNIRPDGGGRLLLQALDLDTAADPANPPTAFSDLADEMISRLSGVLGTTEGATVDKVRVGQRAMPADGLTVAGFTNPTGRSYVVATHSGITLAPLLGQLVAAELYGQESAMLTGFRPGRFTPNYRATAPQPARRPSEQ